jgi:hypothetical protein
MNCLGIAKMSPVQIENDLVERPTSLGYIIEKRLYDFFSINF